MRGGDPYGRPPMDFPIVAPRGARDYPPPRDPYDRYGGGGGGYGGMRSRSPPRGMADPYDRYAAPPRDFPTRPPRGRRDDSPPPRAGGGPPAGPSGSGRFSANGLPPPKSRYDDGLPPRRY